jgi:hypothetical protein
VDGVTVAVRGRRVGPPVVGVGRVANDVRVRGVGVARVAESVGVLETRGGLSESGVGPRDVWVRLLGAFDGRREARVGLRVTGVGLVAENVCSSVDRVGAVAASSGCPVERDNYVADGANALRALAHCFGAAQFQRKSTGESTAETGCGDGWRSRSLVRSRGC